MVAGLDTLRASSKTSFGPPKGIVRKAVVVIEKKCGDLLPSITKKVQSSQGLA